MSKVANVFRWPSVLIETRKTGKVKFLDTILNHVDNLQGRSMSGVFYLVLYSVLLLSYMYRELNGLPLVCQNL